MKKKLNRKNEICYKQSHQLKKIKLEETKKSFFLVKKVTSSKRQKNGIESLGRRHPEDRLRGHR